MKLWVHPCGVWRTEAQGAACLTITDLYFNPVAQIDGHNVGAVHSRLHPGSRVMRNLDVAFGVAEIHTART